MDSSILLATVVVERRERVGRPQMQTQKTASRTGSGFQFRIRTILWMTALLGGVFAVLRMLGLPPWHYLSAFALFGGVAGVSMLLIELGGGPRRRRKTYTDYYSNAG